MKRLLLLLIAASTLALAQKVDLSNQVKGKLAITNGGTGATTAAQARINLGISSGPFFLVSDYDFPAVFPAGALTAATPATITLSCPPGVAGSNASHYLRISGTGTPEPVLITGGTCATAGTTGTITFTPAFSHSAGWQIASDSGGLKEVVMFANGHATIYFDRNRTILVSALPGVVINKDYLTFIGSDWSSVVKSRDNSQSNQTISANTCNYCSFSNFKIDGNRASGGTNAVFGNTLNLGVAGAGGASHTFISRMEITGSQGSGIVINDTQTDIEVSACYIHDNGGTVNGSGSGTGIFVYWADPGNTPASATRFVDNYLSENHNTVTNAGPSSAIAVQGADTTITGNFVRNNYNDGGQLVISHYQSSHALISGNDISMSGTALTQHTSGIESDSNGVVISLNMISEHLQGVGIALEGNPAGPSGGIGASNTIITGNYILDCGSGITLNNAGGITRGTLINGNRIAVGGGLAGVWIDTASAYTSITGNNFTDTTTPVIDNSVNGATFFGNTPMTGNLAYGGSIASADAINMRCGQAATITGSTAIRFIILPAETSSTFGAGCQVALIAATGSAWSVAGGGNISTSVSPAASRTLFLVSDGVLFNPAVSTGGGGGGGSPAGPDTSFQYSNAGSFLGDATVEFVRQIATPAAPAGISNPGTPGSTSYTYQLVARNGIGATAHSAGTVTATGNATLNGSNFNRIPTLAATGVVYYDVYRTASAGTPSTTGRIGSVIAGTPYDDTGLFADGTSAPNTNTTIGIKSVNGFTNGSTPAIIGSNQQGAPYLNPVGIDINLAGQFIGQTVLQPTIIINSSGANFAQVGNNTSTSWFLGYGPNTRLLGTPALIWNDSGLVSIPGSFSVAALNGVGAFTAGLLGVVPGTGTNCVHVDGTSATCGSGGAVTFTGGIVSTTSPFTILGVSGGVPYFTSATTWASSAAGGANLPMLWGGAGASPIAGTRSGNTTAFGTVNGTKPSGNCLEWDGSGNIATAGSGLPCGFLVPVTGKALKGDGGGGALAVTGTTTNCVHVDGTSAACPGGGASIASTTSALAGDGAGNGVAVTGSGANCVHVDGTSAACPGGGTGATSVSGLTDGQPVQSSTTVISVGAFSCEVGNTRTLVGAATITVSAGTGTLRASCDKSVFPPTLKVYHDTLTEVCSGGSCNDSAGSAYGPDDDPLFTATAVSGVWTGFIDYRGLVGGFRLVPGTGIACSLSNGTTTCAVDTTVIPLKLAASTALNFGSIANAACADLTMALTGALTTDYVAPHWPVTGDSGFHGIMWVSAADTVTVRYCNSSGGAIDPASQTFGAMVLR